MFTFLHIIAEDKLYCETSKSIYHIFFFHQILGGCNLPRPSGRDILDPYVKVVVTGVKADEHEFKSTTVKNNGEYNY